MIEKKDWDDLSMSIVGAAFWRGPKAPLVCTQQQLALVVESAASVSKNEEGFDSSIVMEESNKRWEESETANEGTPLGYYCWRVADRGV